MRQSFVNQTYDSIMQVCRDHEHKTSWVGDDDNIWRKVNGGDCWTYTAENPEYSQIFDTAMSIQESFPPEMTPPYPFATELDGSSKTMTFVDVGGGAGQAVESIRKSYPSLQGDFILQDLPKTIECLDSGRAERIGFKASAHDFFLPQPITGARYYHLRRVLHDWNDEACLKILSALRPAFKPQYSKLLIVEFVLEDVNPGPAETLVDLLMMTTCDGGERSVSEWHELLGGAGFKIDDILRAERGATAVIEASLAN
jgi:hypothetical protein